MHKEYNVQHEQITETVDKNAPPEDTTKDDEIEEKTTDSDTIKNILIIKKQTITEEKDDQDIIISTCRNIQAIVKYWIQQKQIEGVKDMLEDGDTFIKDVRDYSRWMSEPKVLGTRVIKVEIFFTIKSGLTIRELIQDQLEFLQQEQIRVDFKRTIGEYTTKVGYIVGLVVDRVNMGWYEEALKRAGRMNEG